MIVTFPKRNTEIYKKKEIKEKGMSSETRKTKRNRNQDVVEILANISPLHWLPTDFISILPENSHHFKLPEMPSHHDQQMSH